MVDVRTNLLKNRQTLSEKDYQRERNLLRGSVFALLVVVVVVVSVSIWNIVLTRQLSNLDTEVRASTKEMEGYVTASTQQIYLKSRLKLIISFLQERSLARESLQKVLSTEIAGTHIATISFVENNVLMVQVGADSIAALNQVLDYYEKDTGYFTQVVSSGIARTRDGSYQVSLNLTLPKEGP